MDRLTLSLTGLAIAALLGSCSGSSDGSLAPPVQDTETFVVENLGVVTAGNSRLTDDHLIFIIREDQLGEDVDNDGLLFSSFLRAYDVPNDVFHDPLVRTLDDTLVAAGSSAVFRPMNLPDHWAFSFPHLQTTRLGRLSSFEPRAGTLAMGVIESFGEDLNFDGDDDDRVMHFYDPVDRSITNTRLAHFEDTHANERFVLFRVDESAQLQDLNSDGDFNDLIQHVYDPVRHEVTSLAAGTRKFVLDGPRLLYLVEESDLGPYLGFLDVDTGAQTRFSAHEPLACNASQAIVRLLEETEGDLNGDGDLEDAVPGILDLPSGLVTPLDLAMPSSSGGKLEDGHFFFLVDELAHGRDLNGDGDVFDEGLLHVLDLEDRTVRALGELASFDDPLEERIAVFGRHALILIDETVRGENYLTQRELNGDLDRSDTFLFLYDLETGTLVNSFLTVEFEPGFFPPDVTDDEYSFAVTEDGIDRNGDGDAVDHVAFTFDARTRSFENHRMSVSPEGGVRNAEGYAIFFVRQGAPEDDPKNNEALERLYRRTR